MSSNLMPHKSGLHAAKATCAAKASTFRAPYRYWAPCSLRDKKHTGRGVDSPSSHCRSTAPTAFWLPSTCTAVLKLGLKCRRTGAETRASFKRRLAAQGPEELTSAWHHPLEQISQLCCNFGV